MAHKELKYAQEARSSLQDGVDAVANAVKVTLGPKGRYVVLDKKFGAPTITNDGVTIAREIERLERRLLVLATVGSAGPFIGLFGTVWGIMNSFAAIAGSQNTSLAVVAPGIAEALFATALGLVAAIPAVLAYNKLSGDIGRYGNRLEAFSGEFGAILSRQLEEKH